VLPSEQTTDNGHVAVLVSPPFDHGRVLPWKPFASQFFLICQRFKGWLVPCQVHVFVHVIQHEFEKFLGILLLVNTPLRVEVTTNALS
jgi:hypothetical protein